MDGKNRTTMTTLKTRIAADYITAFKAKDAIKKSILSTVKGEIQTVEKNTGQVDLDDEGVMKILTKTVKNLNISIAEADDEGSKQELSVLEGYMPKQMSREEVKAKVEGLLAGGATNIGAIMKAFALDAVDKKLVAEVFGEFKTA